MQTENNHMAKAADIVSPLLYLDYKKFLVDVYNEVKLQKKVLLHSYSYLQFSQELGFSKSNVVHLIIQGKRPLSVKAGQKISEALKLTESNKVYFDTLVCFHNEKNTQERERLFDLLLKIKSKELFAKVEKNQLEYFSEWYHPVVRELVSLPDFQESANWICDKVFPKIRPEQARKSLHLLQQLKLISRDEDSGKLKAEDTHVTAPVHAAGIAIIRYHQKLIELARDCLVNVNASERDVSSLSFAISIEQYETIVQEIKDFRKRIVSISEEQGNKNNKIYALNFQFFPLSK